MKRAEDHFSAEQLVELQGFMGRLVQRFVAFDRDADWTLVVIQRCRVCRDEIRKRVSEHGEEDEVLARIATAIRTSYVIHTCPSVEQFTAMFSNEDLDALFTELERDALKIDKRLEEVARLRKERST